MNTTTQGGSVKPESFWSPVISTSRKFGHCTISLVAEQDNEPMSIELYMALDLVHGPGANPRGGMLVSLCVVSRTWTNMSQQCDGRRED